MKTPRRYLRLLIYLAFVQAAMYFTYFGLYEAIVAEALGVWMIDIAHGFQIPPGLTTVFFLTSTWLVLGVASVIVGVGLRRLRPWAWTAALILEGAILVLGLEAYFNRRADISFYLGVAVAVVVTLLLNQREILTLYRAVFVPPEESFGK